MSTVTATRERPILFSGPMVRAILAGSKTQTRRIVKLGHVGTFRRSETKGYDWTFRGSRRGSTRFHSSCWQDLRHQQLIELCPYGLVGHRLWVRETWLPLWHSGAGFDTCLPPTGREGHPDVIKYRADGEKPCDFDGSWWPSIHMRRRYSRITLEITAVRVERLNDISEVDAIAEGLIAWTDPPRVPTKHYGLSRADVWEADPRMAYKRLWESINGANSWAANPWVWVVEFRRLS
jgi:hypothetical protein